MNFLKEKETTLFKIMSLIVIEALEVEKTSITFDARFGSDLGADSLDLYELIYQFEEKLSLSIPDEEAMNIFQTIGSLYQFLQPKCTWFDDPKTAIDYAKRGKAFSGINFALLNYEKALEIDSNCIDALIGRVEVFQDENNHEDAIKDCSKILEISPNYPHVLCYRGISNLGLADLIQGVNFEKDFNGYNINDVLNNALEDFTNAVKANNDDYEALLGRAKTYYRMGKFEEAAKDYKEVVKIFQLVPDAPEIIDLVKKGFDIYDEGEGEEN